MMNLLIVNIGSSSLRLALYCSENGTAPVPIRSTRYDLAIQQATDCLDDFLQQHCPNPPNAVAHRVVHGGNKLTRPCLIDSGVESEIDRLALLAPLHNPAALTMIHACRRRLGKQIPQVAVFDTAFFADLPAVAAHYALPRTLCNKHHIRRFGFHGLAHQAMWENWCRLRPDLDRGGRIITLQLGAGSSIAAIANGQPVDTSMGFSPLEGLVMATRCGDIDPGVILYLERREMLSSEQLGDLLNNRSGLLGLSGTSGDIRELLASSNADASLALSCYCYRLRKYIGAYLTVLQGADAILFGGGVGESIPELRAAVLDNMAWQNIDLNASANNACIGCEAIISKPESEVTVAVTPVNEAEIIARQAVNLLNENKNGKFDTAFVNNALEIDHPEQ